MLNSIDLSPIGAEKSPRQSFFQSPQMGPQNHWSVKFYAYPGRPHRGVYPCSIALTYPP